MNQITRNLILVVLGIVSSLIAAVVMVFAELQSGSALFSYTVATYIPEGAIGAGLLAAAGFYLGAMILRVRPPRLMLIPIVLLAAVSVFSIDTVEYGVAMFTRPSLTNVASVGRFLSLSFENSPIKAAFEGDGSSSDSGSSSSGSAKASENMPSLAGENNAGVQGIGGGVQGMLASGNALSADNIGTSMSGLQKRLQSMKSLGAGALDHAAVLELAALQFVGFSIGGLLVFWRLRSIPHCDECQVFLTSKGAQTRYFDWERDIQNSVNDFLSKVKARRYRQSIEAHSEGGVPEKKSSSEFASTVAISHCKACRRHRLQFSARRKKGMTWKDISMLGYETFCMESVDVMARTAMPTRIR
jgi:hypothetical protein